MTAAGGWAGFDAGGQAVKAVLIADDGTLLAETRRPTGLDIDITGLGSALSELLAEFSRDRRVESRIGLGIAGVMGGDGVLRGSPNLPRLVGEPIGAGLEKQLGREIVVDNDANCAAYAEGLGGAADGCADYLLITVGSGIGSGLVLGERVYHGSTGYACELGHTIVVHEGRRCGCGNRGCLEAYVSESAARAMVGESTGTLRRDVEAIVEREGRGYAQCLFELAAGGNAEAATITASMIEVLGTGLGSAVNLLDVTTIVVGGGIAPAVLRHVEALEAAIDASLFARGVDSIRVLPAARGGDAGAFGAARLAMSA